MNTSIWYRFLTWCRVLKLFKCSQNIKYTLITLVWKVIVKIFNMIFFNNTYYPYLLILGTFSYTEMTSNINMISVINSFLIITVDTLHVNNNFSNNNILKNSLNMILFNRIKSYELCYNICKKWVVIKWVHNKKWVVITVMTSHFFLWKKWVHSKKSTIIPVMTTNFLLWTHFMKAHFYFKLNFKI